MSFDAKKPFDLEFLPPSATIRNEEFVDVLTRTRTELGELNGYSRAIPNPLLLLSPAVLRESVASSSIENINTTLEQALQMQLFPSSEQKKPEKEVLHYHDAVMWGFSSLKKVPISTRLILGIHRRLIPEYSNGYRKTQNKIANSVTGEVLYTPPAAQTIPKLMSNWEAFVNDQKLSIDPLVKCAIAHYQFEAIHPFRDGNGRVGRILIVLSLIQYGLLSLPIHYVSGYINKHRSEYYRLLREVSKKANWKEFIGFMLTAFHLQAKETKETILKIMELFEGTKERLRTKYRKIYSAELVEALFANPIITPVNLGKKLDVNYRTASRYLVKLSKGKELQERFVGKYHFFINKRLIDLLKR